jgi:HEAT repeat protein
LENEPGFTIWMDAYIEPGSIWKQAIDNAINDSIAILVIITPESLKSQYVTYEWSYALGKGKKVIPLLLEPPDPNNPSHPKIHPKLDDIQRGTDFSEYPQNVGDQAWQELAAILRNVLSQDFIPDDILEAKQMLASGDPQQQERAIWNLEEAQNEHAHNVLVEFVGNRNQRINKLASFALAESYEDDASVPGLLIVLKSGTREDKSQVIRDLEMLGAVESVPSLIRLLKDTREDGGVRHLALTAITRIGGESGITGLLEFIETADTDSDPYISAEVVSALGQIGDTRAIPVLKAIQKTRKLGGRDTMGRITLRGEMSTLEERLLETLSVLGDEEGQQLYLLLLERSRRDPNLY